MWVRQFVFVVLYVCECGGIYYFDFWFDNVVFMVGGDLVMVDFEQWGVWCEFVVFEVNVIVYVYMLVVDEGVEEEGLE